MQSPPGINPKLTAREINACLDVLNPKLAIVGNDLSGTVDAKRFTCEYLAPGTSAETVAAEFRIAEARPVAPLTEDLDRVVCVCFTSGSTGPTERCLVRQPPTGTDRRTRYRGCLGRWRARHQLHPNSHTVGFMTKLPWLLASGRTTHLLERWSAGPVAGPHRRTPHAGSHRRRTLR